MSDEVKYYKYLERNHIILQNHVSHHSAKSCQKYVSLYHFIISFLRYSSTEMDKLKIKITVIKKSKNNNKSKHFRNFWP